MPKTVRPCQILELESFLKISSLCASPNQEQKLGEEFQCRAAFHPEPKRLLKTLNTGDDDDGLGHKNATNSSHENKDLPLKWPRARRGGGTESLRKHLCHSRKMVLAVKKGCSYFHLLQEQEEQRNEQRRRKEEKRRCELRLPSSIPDSDREIEEQRKSPWRQGSRGWNQALRPFTPVHLSLMCDQPQELSEERVYHQLCCLCWLLESLTLENSGKFGLVVSCWDSKHLSRGRSTLRAVKREKAIQAEWERFISPTKPQCPIFRLSRMSSVRPSTWKSSGLSVMSSSLGNMSTCDVTFSSEESEGPSAATSETEPPVSKYLQMLLDEVHQSVRKELYGSQGDNSSDTNAVSFRAVSHTQDTAFTGKMESHTPKSSPSERSGTCCSSLSVTKAAMLDEIKQRFEERTEELSQSLTDALNSSAKLRWSSDGQRHQSLSNGASLKTQIQDNGDTTDTTPYSTQWLSALLNNLSAHTHSSRKVQCVLEKLKRFAGQRILRVRPHAFLRVLNSLPPLDLCCPDLCVAIEIVRENAVKLSAEDYDCWLWSKVNHKPER